MSRKNVKKKVKIYSIVFITVVFVASVCTCIFFSKASNKRKVRAQLEQIASRKNLEFQANLNSQITLALQMCRSPVVIDYFMDPEDKELEAQAVKEIAAYQDSFLGKTSFWANNKDLKFYSDLKYSYTIDPENPGDYWYKMTVFETDVYNFNINYNPELNKTMLWLNVVVRDKDGNPIGMAGTGIPLTEFINEMYKDMPEKVQMYLYNDNLEITGAKDSSILADKISISKYYKNITKNNALCNTLTNYSEPNGEFVLTPIKVIGWNLLLFSPSGFSDYFTKDGIMLALVMIGLSLVIMAVYSLLIKHILKDTTVHLMSTEEKAGSQVEVMDQVSSTIKENVEYLESFGNLIDCQIKQIATSVDNTTELMTDLEAMNVLRKDSIESTNDLNESSSKGNQHITNITEKIDELNECTKRLSSANELIAGITSKTNLLAMNASIEASHAGEQGKGFAVVAKEIRALAEKSRMQQQDVRRAIDDINQMVSEMVQYSQTAKTSFEEIVSNIQRVQSNFLNMSDKLESEASLVQTISANLQSVTTSSQKIILSFDEMKQSNQLVNNEIQSALDSSNQFLLTTDDLLKTMGDKDE
ncbi:MAG: hypothetical protein J6Y36_07740 [Treponema sp.]|uniref:methyl-accepting chemotaxis protein n=1 Tax=Treponema sp. TaxID=166 RepID=UPI001B76D2D0|nr:methyl-accepting chemotaxis protein [Treponema sp.]MBP5403033.1 hypothetical protein [Treponema sp.]MBR5934252.1 hypothetical protein [Treponema sp.]